ncbi:GH25 family lysozyme [Lentilactobacillus hilgardii]|uniref:GH25 family lysozyme n=1 Tax=Lentilactobacillus hilgardii TaxID=1588 RepID=UPI00390CCDD3
MVIQNRIRCLALLVAAFVLVWFAMGQVTLASSVSKQSIPDLSEWQGSLSATEVKKLKETEPFIILRAQYGSGYADKDFVHNAALCKEYGLKYGAYSYSLYTSAADAEVEAKDLYDRAPNASFYVNDYEQQTVTSGSTNTATTDWYQELHKLAPHKRVLFYSYDSFAQKYAANAMKSYDGYWLASYTSSEPTVSHDLWQYTDNWYTSSLGQYVDASKEHVKNTSWFLSAKPIAYGKIVSEKTSGYKIWRNLMFTASGGETETSGKTYLAKYYYNHYNGHRYYSLYSGTGKWVGYVNSSAVRIMAAKAYPHTATIRQSNYSFWSNFLWTSAKHQTSDYLNQTFDLKYKYERGNGTVYYSLYRNGIWYGYVNALATLKPVTINQTVTITKSGQTIWENLFFTAKNGTSELNQSLTAKYAYKDANGYTYDSLYDGTKWLGYVNTDNLSEEANQ